MISKDIRNKILNSYEKKEEKIFVASLIDIASKFENTDRIFHTNFLDNYESSIASHVLNTLKISYVKFDILEDIQRTVIFFIPEYLNKKDLNEIFDEYIAVLKIKPGDKEAHYLKHKDYMGTLYSMGIKENLIGDIFVNDKGGYVFLFRTVIDYFLNNLDCIKRYKVKNEVLSVNSDEVRTLKISYKSEDLIISSLRVDNVLATLYKMSRSEVKDKIQNGDLIINSKEMFFVACNINENDIVSFRKCGKFKVGKIIRNTKSGKIVLNVKKYT